MDSFEFNKVAMSLLGVLFVVMSLSFLSEGLFHSEKPETPGYIVDVAEASADGAAKEAGPAYDPINELLAAADIAAGEKVSKKCTACHTFDDGGADKVGPHLWGVVGRPIAGAEGFSYSSALKEYAADKTWTYDELNGFLWKPKAHVKGTSMGFAGVKKTQDRANLVAYLRSLSASPVPLPGE